MNKKLFETLHFYSFILLLILPHTASIIFIIHMVSIFYIYHRVLTSWVQYQNCPIYVKKITQNGEVLLLISTKDLNIKTNKWTKFI